MKHWKTTLAGIAALLTVLAKIANQLSSGEGLNVTAEELGLLVVGGGLLSASDSTKESK